MCVTSYCVIKPEKQLYSKEPNKTQEIDREQGGCKGTIFVYSSWYWHDQAENTTISRASVTIESCSVNSKREVSLEFSIPPKKALFSIGLSQQPSVPICLLKRKSLMRCKYVYLRSATEDILSFLVRVWMIHPAEEDFSLKIKQLLKERIL